MYCPSAWEHLCPCGRTRLRSQAAGPGALDPAAQSVRNSVSAPVSTPYWLLRGFGGPPAYSWIGLGRGGLGLQGGRNGIKQHLPPHEGPHLTWCTNTHTCVSSYVQLHMPNRLHTLQNTITQLHWGREVSCLPGRESHPHTPPQHPRHTPTPPPTTHPDQAEALWRLHLPSGPSSLIPKSCSLQIGGGILLLPS